MHRIDDAKIVLKSANDKFSNIKTLYNKCEYDDSLCPELRLEIKGFLENIRSCLDYTTNYIFDTRCKQNFEEKDLKKVQKKIYFPNQKDKKFFDNYIKHSFIGLTPNDPVVLLWEKNQLFYNSSWVSKLCDITNSTKHIELVKNRRTESGTINYMKIGGITIKNNFCNNNGRTLVINDTPVSIKEFNTHPSIKNFNGHIKANYTFSQTNTPVIETLEEILEGAANYLNEFCTLL